MKSRYINSRKNLCDTNYKENYRKFFHGEVKGILEERPPLKE